MPLVKPVIVIGLTVPVAVMPLFDVTVYNVIALPFDAGATKLTVACVFPGAAVTAVGAPGRPAGVTLLEAADATLAPIALFATTVNVYAVPLVSPVTTIGLDAPVAVIPLFAVTVYEVIVLPPLDAGTVNATDAVVSPAVAVPIVGAPGTVAGVTLLEAADAALVPTPLVAVTVNV